MLSRFRIYLHLFLNEASSHVAYRFNTFLGMASRIVFIFVQFAIWRALYGGRDAMLWVPETLAGVFRNPHLPFRLLYFAPSATWLGKIAAADAAWLIAWQWVWIGGLLVLQRVLWLAGIRKVVVQGG